MNTSRPDQAMRVLTLGLVGLGLLGGPARATADEPKATPVPPIPRNRMSHDSGGAFITFSPDGNTLAASGTWFAGTTSLTMFKLWEVATGRELNTIKTPRGWNQCAAYSPDGKTIAIQIEGVSGGTEGNRIKIYDTATGQEKLTIKLKWDVRSLVFSPDGKALATGGEVACLWDVETGAEKAILKGTIKPGSYGDVTFVAFSPDGKTLATACSDNTIRLWDPATGKEKAVLDGHVRAVTSLAFSPDGKTLASVGGTGTIKLWDVATELIRDDTMQVHEGFIWSVAFSPDGRLIASGGTDKLVRVWDLKTKKELAVMKGHAKNVTCVAFRPDGKTLASASADGTVKLWDLETFKEPGVIRGGAEAGAVCWAAFSPDSKLLAFGGHVPAYGQGERSLWSLSTGKPQATIKEDDETYFGTASGTFSPDGSTLVTGGGWAQTQIKFWDWKTGKKVRALEWKAGQSTHQVGYLSYTPDGKTLITSTYGGMALWDLGTGKIRAVIGKPDVGVFMRYALSPDGKTLAVCDETVLRVVDVATGKERKSFKPHAGHALCVAFSPDGKTIATGSGRDVKVDPGTDGRVGEIKLWDAATGEEQAALEGHTGFVGHLAYSPDGKTLASACWGDDKTIILWDAATGRKRETLKGHASGIVTLAFSPDGKTLATSSGNTSVMLWDVSPEK